MLAIPALRRPRQDYLGFEVHLGYTVNFVSKEEQWCCVKMAQPEISPWDPHRRRKLSQVVLLPLHAPQHAQNHSKQMQLNCLKKKEDR